ncbi:MAG: hypothetical protein SOY26_05100 [Paludibacteraceae bacterium]|nr:hypothetical protein [Paludibacteraceae bacterium]
MKSRLLCLLVLCSMSIISSAQCYTTHRADGIAAYNQGRYAEAKKHFEYILSSCPDKPANNDVQSWIDKCNQKDNYRLAKETNTLLQKAMYGKATPQEVLFWEYPSFNQLVKNVVSNSKHFELMSHCWLFDKNEWMEFAMGSMNSYTQVVRGTKLYEGASFELEFVEYYDTDFVLTIKFYWYDKLEATYKYES